ncbi:MAG: SpoIID/LytB domain-containing protein [Tissierellaceae bacterium]|nr:SpoIID/LytB domain-containing protein [Tissierellaceae bacterium]
MRRLICMIMVLSVLIVSFPFKSYGEEGIADFIDVKIEKSKEFNQAIKLYSEYGFNFYDKNNKDNVILTIEDTEIEISGNDKKAIEVYGVDGILITTLPEDGSLVIGSVDIYNSIIKVDENRYRDYITFLNNGFNLLIINHINIENYLFGVVPREIPASSHIDALRAQAIVARSYAYTTLKKHISEGYNLCSTTHCQVYGGYDWEHPNTNQSVIDTYGEYVTYDGQVVNTPFHSSSGGHTESSENVWGGKLPYLVPVNDIYSINAPNSSWSIKLTPRELGDKLLANGINVGEVKDLQILQTTDSDRVEKIRIIGSNSEEVITGEKLRSIVGTTSLKSTLFSINKEGSSSSKKVYIVDGSEQTKEVNLSGMYIIDGSNKTTVNRNANNRVRGDVSSTNIEGTVSVQPTTFTFEGKGYGHGVGMSQYGAIEMAKLGYNYMDIIKHYYNGVEITNYGK